MEKLLETLTAEPHYLVSDFSWYDTIERELEGKTLVIEVEVLTEWDGTPRPEIKYYVRVPKDTEIGDGLMIKADSVIMLSEQEMDDFLYARQLTDFISDTKDADDHERSIRNERR